MLEDDIHVLENNCWNHQRNVWFGAVVKELSSHLGLNVIHSMLRVTTDPNSIFRAIEKVFGETANYAKGS